jgi:hypothetical protein
MHGLSVRRARIAATAARINASLASLTKIAKSLDAEVRMVRRQTLKKVGGSVATVLPKSMLQRFHLDAGDEVYVVETSEGC